MNVTIHGHNWKISDALEEFIRKKVDKLDRYLPNITDIRVDVSRQKTSRGANQTIAQITLRHKRGAILRAEERMGGEDRDTIEAVVNVAVDKMYRQIRRFKGKRESKRRKTRERFMATVEELALAEAIPAEIEEEEDDVFAGELDDIVRRKEIDIAPMSEAEAIEQMELLGHNFFLFFNDTTESVSVLYKRNSGGYGILVPKV